MSVTQIVRKIRFKRQIASEWERVNPILEDGEPGYEKGTGRMKVGDGVTAWQALPYFTPAVPVAPGSSDVAVAAHIADETPHPVYDDGPSFLLHYENQKV